MLYPVPPALAPRRRRARVAVAAGDPALLAGLLAAVAAAPERADLDVELEIETGLGRGGAPRRRRGGRRARDRPTPGARLAGVWTHLQAVEDAPRTGAQVERYEAALAALAAAGIDVPRRHLAASAGILARACPRTTPSGPG